MSKAKLHVVPVTPDPDVNYSEYRINLLSTLLNLGEEARLRGFTDDQLDNLVDDLEDAFLLGAGYRGELTETTDWVDPEPPLEY